MFDVNPKNSSRKKFILTVTAAYQYCCLRDNSLGLLTATAAQQTTKSA
jgi:hypothetical protein